MRDDGWTSATPELAAAFRLLSASATAEADAGTCKRQRGALNILFSAIATEKAWARLPPLLDAVEPGAILAPEQFRFAVKSLRAGMGDDLAPFAAAIWPAPDHVAGATAAVLGATCHKAGLKPQARHYLDAAQKALGPALPVSAVLDWCRFRLTDKAYDDVARETARHLEIVPGHAGLAITQSEALQHLGRLAEAIKLLARLTPNTPEDSAAVAMQLAKLYLRDGRPDKARSTLGKSADETFTGTARIDRVLLRADALLALGDVSAAAKLLATYGGTHIDPVRQERLLDRRTRCLMMRSQVEEAMALLSALTTNVDLLRKTIIGGILLGDLGAVNAAEEALTKQLVANWRPGQGSPGYNQHLLFARNTRLNAGFGDICRTLMNAPDAAAIDLLRPFIRDVPFDYSAAIQLIFRMARRGWLNQPPKHGEVAIPRRIVFFWDKPRRPPDIDRLIGTWREFNPGYEIEVFDEASARGFLAGEIDQHHAEALGRCQNAAMKADFFRLCYLQARGGIYADCDDRCRAPIDGWLGGRDTVLAHENHMTFAVANNFMATLPGQPWLETAIEQALIALDAPVRSFTFYVTGPGLLTMCLAQWLARQEPSALPKFRLLSMAEYSAKVSPHLPLSYKLAGQHWVKQEGAGV